MPYLASPGEALRRTHLHEGVPEAIAEVTTEADTTVGIMGIMEDTTADTELIMDNIYILFLNGILLNWNKKIQMSVKLVIF